MRIFHTFITACCLTSSIALGQVPTYRVEPISTYTTLTGVNGANELGQVVGYQLVASQSQPYVATEANGMMFLPLPVGYDSGLANDINDLGVVVGSVSSSGFPEPAVWTPNGSGGYDVAIPDQFSTLPSPLGDLPISGSLAVAISNNGTIVGTSIYQGFQGGPTTQFSLTGPPINLGALGFAATVTAINDNDVIVGGGIRMDLTTGVVTNLGVPPSSAIDPNYAFVIAYAVNDQNETVVAAQQATSSNNWVTFYHNDTDGFTRLHPTAVPSPFVGIYDNNDLGDIAASGGVLFSAEDVLVGSFDGLLDAASAHWDTNLGKIANDRRVYTTAHNTLTGVSAIVQLVPVPGPVKGNEVVRLGTPENPNVLLPGQTSAPVLGAKWDPIVDHTSFVTDAIVDVLWITALPANVPLANGSLLCMPDPILVKAALPGTSFTIPVPQNSALIGASLCSQAASFNATSAQLTNALDITIGIY